MSAQPGSPTLAPESPPPSNAFLSALSAAAVTVPHALGLGLLAFAPFADEYAVGSLALWSAAVPGALMTVASARRGVIYAPTTIVGLLYASIVATVMGMAPLVGMGAAQVLAVCGVTVALACGFQWIFGALRLASLARFLPVSVTYGFAAGVGVSMVVSQFASGFGLGHWDWSTRLGIHALAAIAVLTLARLLQRRWRRVPGLLPATGLVSCAIVLLGVSDQFTAAASSANFAWPPIPDWLGVPWLKVLHAQGTRLTTLALLMAVVNSLDILVFNQELELDYRLPGDPNAALRRESLVGMVCAMAGLIPASTSASRSRIALGKAGSASSGTGVSAAHALIMLVVAATGTLWLPWVPMACLSGALMLAGLTQVPAALWSRTYARNAPAVWFQSWLVASVFAVAGGAGALVAGLVVATFVLMHASASTALRRALLDGQIRSRRLRRAEAEAWLSPRMQRLAVFELQGVMSFGVAAHTGEQLRKLMQAHHDRVILEASRVAAWDATALVRIAALCRDLQDRGVFVAISGLDRRARATLEPVVTVFADLDRALEWAEEAILDERTPEERLRSESTDILGELGEGIRTHARQALIARIVVEQVGADALIFKAGAHDRDLLIVQSGRVTLATAWPADNGLRLATVGRGMAFGEMAFLNGQQRSAYAGAEGTTTEIARLDRQAFDNWASAYPDAALCFMGNLAIIGTRRLAATTRQLRGVLE